MLIKHKFFQKFSKTHKTYNFSFLIPTIFVLE